MTQSDPYESLVEKFVKWAETCPDIRGAVIVGSRAREDHPADEWADLDILIITKDPERYILTADWVENIGSPILTFVEPTPGDDMERRVLFEGMCDVDFAIVPHENVQQVLQMEISPQLAAEFEITFGRGMRPLLDKDGLIAQFQVLLSSLEPPSPHPPTHLEFLEVINDFLYHAVWTTKKLQRGELWMAKLCCDNYMKGLLCRMIEWHARVTRGWDYDTWFRGRFLEEWADPRVLNELQEVFASYNVVDIRRALKATMALFRWVATETAERLNCSYPIEQDKRIKAWIEVTFQE